MGSLAKNNTASRRRRRASGSVDQRGASSFGFDREGCSVTGRFKGSRFAYHQEPVNNAFCGTTVVVGGCSELKLRTKYEGLFHGRQVQLDSRVIFSLDTAILF